MKRLPYNLAVEAMPNAESVLEEQLLNEAYFYEDFIYDAETDNEKVELIDELFRLRKEAAEKIKSQIEVLYKKIDRLHATERTYTSYYSHVRDSMGNKYYGNGQFLKPI